jgi:uncharacterized FAD-dependent dehydrogenase
LGSGVAFPAGTIVQTKVVKDSTARGAFTTIGDNYTGISISFDNNLQNTNSNVLIESSLEVDCDNDIGLGLTWATSSSTLSGNKIGVDGSTVNNLTQGYVASKDTASRGGHFSFMAYDSNITSTTPKTYYLWLINPVGNSFNINTNGSLGQTQNLISYWVGAATSVFKLIEIAG